MKTRFKRFATLGLLALLLAALLAGCAGQPNLPEGMDAAQVEAQAKQFIDTANAANYEELANLFSPEYYLAPEEWQAALDPLWEQFGAFQSYGKTSFATVDQAPYGVAAVALVECNYENQKLVWQVAIDTNWHIVAFVA